MINFGDPNRVSNNSERRAQKSGYESLSAMSGSFDAEAAKRRVEEAKKKMAEYQKRSNAAGSKLDDYTARLLNRMGQK